MAIKSLSIRIEEEMLDKLHVIADYEGRSANSQILVLIRDLIESYEAKHGEKPSVKKIAEALSITEEEAVRALEVGGTLSLDGMVSGADGEAEGSLYSVLADGEDKYEAFETKETLRAAMRDFTDTEKALIKYRYVDELSQSETAKRLGVSQMFVSRMERKLLLKLKDNLKDTM